MAQIYTPSREIKLFFHTRGSWDMNWIAYNFAHDVALRGSTRKPLGYFMYPQGETSQGALDSLDPEHFQYSIKVREVTTA